MPARRTSTLLREVYSRPLNSIADVSSEIEEGNMYCCDRDIVVIPKIACIWYDPVVGRSREGHESSWTKGLKTVWQRKNAGH